MGKSDHPLHVSNIFTWAKGIWGQFLGLGAIYLVFFLSGAPQSLFLLDTTKLVLVDSAIVGVGALGMTLVIISGGIDLSVGSIIALTSVCSALALQAATGGGLDGWSLAVAGVAGGVLAGAFVGFLNGLAIVALRIVPFIATLGMLGLARGTAKILSGERMVHAPRTPLNDVMLFDRGSPFWHLPVGVWILLGLAVAMGCLLHFTVLGRYAFAIGSNEATARLCGLPVRSCKLAFYAICGALTGVAGVLTFGRLTLGDATAAPGRELDIIAATVIGGGSLSGGRGSILGSLIGAYIMALLRTGCVQMGWPNPVQEIVIGVIIVLAVALDSFRQRKAI